MVGPTIFGHAGAASAIAVGAVRFNNSRQTRALLLARARSPTTSGRWKGTRRPRRWARPK